MSCLLLAIGKNASFMHFRIDFTSQTWKLRPYFTQSLGGRGEGVTQRPFYFQLLECLEYLCFITVLCLEEMGGKASFCQENLYLHPLFSKHWVIAIPTHPASPPNEAIDGWVPSLPAGLCVIQQSPQLEKHRHAVTGRAPCSAHSTENREGIK